MQPDFLRRTLQSVFIQSFEDYEVIVTDDSIDSSVEDVVKEFQPNNKLKYFKNKERKGSPENWNEAINLASGEYIKMLHHDDWFTCSDSLNEFVKMLDDNPNADFAFSSTIAQPASASCKSWIHRATNQQLEEMSKDPSILFLGNIIGAPSTTIYRKKVNTLFDKNLKWVVDCDFYIRLLRDNIFFVNSDKPLIITTAGADHQVTNECYSIKNVEIYENFYLYDKIKRNICSSKKKCLAYLIELVNKHGIKSIKEIRDCRYTGSVPISVFMSIIKHRIISMFFSIFRFRL